MAVRGRTIRHNSTVLWAVIVAVSSRPGAVAEGDHAVADVREGVRRARHVEGDRLRGCRWRLDHGPHFLHRARPLLGPDMALRVRLDHRRRRRVVHRPPQRGPQQRDGRGDHERDGGQRLPAGRSGPRGRATGGCGNADVRGNHSGHAGDCLTKRAGARTAVTSAMCSPRTVSTSSDWQVARRFAVQPTASMDHHSLLDAAQRLMPASVAYWSMALSSSSANARLSSAATLASSWATLLAPMTSEVTRGSRSAQARAIWARL